MKKNLIIDRGNTQTKAAVFTYGELSDVSVFSTFGEEEASKLLDGGDIHACIFCSVGAGAPEAIRLLAGRTDLIELTHTTPLPFTNGYASPATLGMDRIAAVAGATHFFSGTSCLVIDAGTCITYDFIDASGIYKGGAISPGLAMRLKAMHHFTEKLPELTFREPAQLTGTDTETSMMAGVWYGIIGEINEITSRYEQEYGQLQVLTCGGDSALFDKHIKRDIFAAPFLVLYGLNKILEFNAP